MAYCTTWKMTVSSFRFLPAWELVEPFLQLGKDMLLNMKYSY